MYISCIQQKWQKLRSPSPKVMLSSLHIASRYRTHPVLFYHATFTVSIMLLHDCTEESLTQAFGSPHARKGVKPTMMAAGWWLWGPCHWKAKWSSWKLRQGAMGQEFTWRLEGSMRRIFVSRDALLNMMVLPSLFKAQLRCNIWKQSNAHHRYHLRCFMQREIWAFQTWPRTWSPARATREINIWIRQVLHMWHLGCASPSRIVPL